MISLSINLWENKNIDQQNSQHNERNGEIGRGEYRRIQCVKTAKYERQGEGRSLKKMEIIRKQCSVENDTDA